MRPILCCCEAAGGELAHSLPVTGAWGALYTAAHLLDNVQDGDLSLQQSQLGPAAAINVAVGLIFTAQVLLQRLEQFGAPAGAAREIPLDFSGTLLIMASGQHADLCQTQPSLDECWRVAEAKSGSFFALACRAGARLGPIDGGRIAHYSSFGRALGLIIQIHDDLTDLSEDKPALLRGIRSGRWSLPTAYFMHTAPADQRDRLLELSREVDAADEAIAILDAAGARLYLTAKVEEQRQIALQALESTGARGPARAALEQLIHFTQAAG